MTEHPFNVRDDACWACMIAQLSQSDDPAMPAMVEGLQAALQSPYRDRELAVFDTNNPGIRPAIEDAWQLCRHRLECR
jgi:hypothetical protein